MPPRPLVVEGVPIRDDWSFVASSDPVSRFNYANVDWRQLSEQPDSALSRSTLAGIACNQRQVGLTLQQWHQSAPQVLHCDQLGHCTVLMYVGVKHKCIGQLTQG